jgi:hypothetical protein
MFDFFFAYPNYTSSTDISPLFLFFLSTEFLLRSGRESQPQTHMANVAKEKSTNMAATFGADRKYRSARGKGGYSKPTKVNGVIKMLRNVRIRLYMATTIAALPFMVSFALYVSLFSFFGQFVIGFLCGLCVEFAYLLLNLHRTHMRRHLVCKFYSSGYSLWMTLVLLDLFCLFCLFVSLIQFRHPSLNSDRS